MPVFQLPEQLFLFPHPSLAEDSGLLAVGGGLEPERIVLAYNFGIFPWYNSSDPILWWSPHPRMVLFPGDLKVSRSMRPYLNQPKFQFTENRAFAEVINRCQKTGRKNQAGTWITHEMKTAYLQLHEMGIAKSYEVWDDGQLVGGLYGISLGKIFFGESMFSIRPNASKFGFIKLVRLLEERGFWLIDCQQETAHLKSLGAKLIARSVFLEFLGKNRLEQLKKGSSDLY